MANINDFINKLKEKMNSKMNYSSNSKTNYNSNNSNLKITSENLEEALNNRYRNIDGENKLRGKLYSKLIEETNEIINNANAAKQNTKI